LKLPDGVRPFDLLLANTNDQFVKFELDVYWAKKGDVDPVAYLKAYKSRFRLVHLKDMAVDLGNPVDAEVGEGNLDWEDILRACREARTEWLVVEQDAPRRDPMESVAISYANLATLTANLGWGG